MNANFTQDLAKLEEYSLAMIDFIEKLPESFFDDEQLQPSKKVIDNIVAYSKRKGTYLRPKDKLFRFGAN